MCSIPHFVTDSQRAHDPFTARAPSSTSTIRTETDPYSITDTDKLSSTVNNRTASESEPVTDGKAPSYQLECNNNNTAQNPFRLGRNQSSCRQSQQPVIHLEARRIDLKTRIEGLILLLTGSHASANTSETVAAPTSTKIQTQTPLPRESIPSHTFIADNDQHIQNEQIDDLIALTALKTCALELDAQYLAMSASPSTRTCKVSTEDSELGAMDAKGLGVAVASLEERCEALGAQLQELNEKARGTEEQVKALWRRRQADFQEQSEFGREERERQFGARLMRSSTGEIAVLVDPTRDSGLR